MISSNRFVGGILLVAGTATGAGMLALPVISCFGGFFPSLALLGICWLFLFATSIVLLDVNLSFPGEVNLVTMAGKTLGAFGKAVCWSTYLLLLYSLTAAYIAGSAPIFLQAFHALTGLQAPEWIGPFPLLLLFGTAVYLGTQTVDWVNRILMAALIVSYLLLVVFLPPHVQPELLTHVDLKGMWIAVPILITSYGFHIIIPTLTTYLDRDRKKLRLTLLIGSLIPFIIYAIWNLLILGVIPLTGEHGLVQAFVKGETGAPSLSFLLNQSWIPPLANAFSLFAILTSFLGVSLSLSDFLTDGFHMKRFSLGREFACLLTFIPPLLFVLLYQRGFILALQFAGIFVVILLCILPALMAWKLPPYRTPLRRLALCALLLLSLAVIGLDLLEQTGFLNVVRYLPI